MNLIVIGPEHSGTRYFWGLMSLHPEINKVIHASCPDAGKWVTLKDYLSREFSEEERDLVKIILVCRDESCNLASQNRFSSMKNHPELLHETGCKNGIEAARKFLISQLSQIQNKVILVSYETIVQYKELYLRQIFKEIGVNPVNYKYEYKGPIESSWFKVSAVPEDGNKKYVRLF